MPPFAAGNSETNSILTSLGNGSNGEFVFAIAGIITELAEVTVFLLILLVGSLSVKGMPATPGRKLENGGGTPGLRSPLAPNGGMPGAALPKDDDPNGNGPVATSVDPTGNDPGAASVAEKEPENVSNVPNPFRFETGLDASATVSILVPFIPGTEAASARIGTVAPF